MALDFNREQILLGGFARVEQSTGQRIVTNGFAVPGAAVRVVSAHPGAAGVARATPLPPALGLPVGKMPTFPRLPPYKPVLIPASSPLMAEPLLITLPAPSRGIVDGLDPALPAYPLDAAQVLRNFRVASGRWKTRAGQSSWKTVGTTGPVHGLYFAYRSTGQRVRLAWRNGVLYYLREGTESVFTVDPSGSTFQPNTIHAVTMKDRVYFLDQSDANLWKWDLTAAPASALTKAVQPVKPTAAPSLSARIRDVIEDWSSPAVPNGSTTPTEPDNWTSSDLANTPLYLDKIGVSNNPSDPADIESTHPPMQPSTSQFATIRWFNSGSGGDTCTRDFLGSFPSGYSLNSAYIAFWWYQGASDNSNHHVSLQTDDGGETFGTAGGTVQSGSYAHWAINPTQLGTWQPIFLPVGDIEKIPKLQLIIDAPNETGGYANIGRIYLPGKLDGEYRWRYTHYNPLTNAESIPSAIGNHKKPIDFATTSSNYGRNQSQAFRKCCLVGCASDIATDSTTTSIRIWRNGGSASLTKDDNGLDVWTLVQDINDFSKTITGAVAAGVDTQVTVNSILETINSVSTQVINVGDWVVLDRGAATEEFVHVLLMDGAGNRTLHLNASGAAVKFKFAHANGATVEPAYLDNNADSEIADNMRMDPARDDAPAGGKWIAKSPDGRLVICGTTANPNRVFVSDRPTPDRHNDFEVFPGVTTSVDPIINRDPIQGWPFDVGGDVGGEEIAWGGYFQGLLTILTRRALYRCYAASQAVWGPNSVVRVMWNVGCLSGDTVREVNGKLFWASDQGRILRWDGSSAPEIVSHLRTSTTLSGAPRDKWSYWFAEVHPRLDGYYYCLWYTGSASDTFPKHRLDYNTDTDAWEEVAVFDSSAARVPMQVAALQDGTGDTKGLFVARAVSGVTTGYVYQSDDPTPALTDYIDATHTAVAITAAATTPRVALGAVSMILEVAVRLLGVTADTFSMTVTAGGSEAGDVSYTYNNLSVAGAGDQWVRMQVNRELQGEWVEIALSGSFSSAPAFRDIEIRHLPLRTARAAPCSATGESA